MPRGEGFEIQIEYRLGFVQRMETLKVYQQESDQTELRPRKIWQAICTRYGWVHVRWLQYRRLWKDQVMKSLTQYSALSS